MRIERHDLNGHEIAEFLDDHLRQMREVTPLESKHALDLEALRAPEIYFCVAYDEDGRLLGTGAVKDLGGGHGEIKSMRTRPDAVRTGVASRLLAHLIEYAGANGMTRLSLETGSTEFFAPARALYERHGFEATEPFASYTDDPNSAYYTITLG